ncbi:MAG: copper amine oxidase N-terminal domain-containing protein [Syntrophothermus sp.]|uniref:copper amine oxidase N-terminal domain-containing protein n=1 Tax=Syntrophothermus sp. TaxID=2736299 RepID=UPI0025805107|nr:copper amine oxidase N-terminal domain-containing protein [Syntrophothermus sp.]NSW83609.1 copper amine oxidase N-terminal domain-containing protein [Syntrophothermus sp.]
MVRKTLFVTLLLLFVVTLSVPAQPAQAVVTPDQTDKVIVSKFWIGEKYYEVNGQRYEMDVAPYIDPATDRTMIPFRYLAYSLGIPEKNIVWHEKTQSVEILREDASGYVNAVQVWIDSDVLETQKGRSQLDAVPRIVNDRTMIPYRAAAQGLGALVFWDPDDQSITVETWKVAPARYKQTVKKVVTVNDKPTATVTYMDGTTKEVATPTPAQISYNGGWMLNALEYFKLWSIPDEAILYDAERGGIIVRGSENSNAEAYMILYAGEKYAWGSCYMRTEVRPDTETMYISNGGGFIGGWPVSGTVVNLFGKEPKGEAVKKGNIFVKTLEL